MPQTHTIVQEVYQFEELSDAAKEKAREWYRSCPFDNDFDCEIDEFVTVAEAIGIDFDTHNVNLHGGGMRQEPNIYWSVGYCQSDHASFEGTYDYKADAVIKLRAINNDDTWAPLRIAQALAKIQCENAFGIHVEIKNEMRDITYWDRRNDMRDVGKDGSDAGELMRDLARYLYDQLRAQSDYLHSDEHVDESIIVNEYEFDEEGERI